MIQLDMLEENEMMVVLAELKKIKDSAEKSRRSLFARFNELEKIVFELREMIQK